MCPSCLAASRALSTDIPVLRCLTNGDMAGIQEWNARGAWCCAWQDRLPHALPQALLPAIAKCIANDCRGQPVPGVPWHLWTGR